MDTTKITTAARNGKHDLAQGLRHMIDETDQFLKSAGTSGDQKFDAAREKFVEQVQQMREQLDAVEESARYRAKRAARVANQTVHAHPYGAMGIAAAAGMLIGFLASRR
ncbi:MAG: DUF883 family protein [Burkholderiales bacterium]|nr:DUF883 family protein [Burkholderiales bacterium]